MSEKSPKDQLSDWVKEQQKEAKQPDKKEPSIAAILVAGMLGSEPEKIAERRADQPSFGAEMKAVVRGGREDLWNAIIPAFPESMQASREQGAPGSPTAQLTTEDLMGRSVDAKTDTLEQPKDLESLMAMPTPQTPEQGREGRGGRE